MERTRSLHIGSDMQIIKINSILKQGHVIWHTLKLFNKSPGHSRTLSVKYNMTLKKKAEFYCSNIHLQSSHSGPLLLSFSLILLSRTLNPFPFSRREDGAEDDCRVLGSSSTLLFICYILLFSLDFFKNMCTAQEQLLHIRLLADNTFTMTNEQWDYLLQYLESRGDEGNKGLGPGKAEEM